MPVYGARSRQMTGTYIHLKSLYVMKIIYTYHVAERWNMSMDEEVYCQEKARSLSSLKSDSQHSTRHCSKHLGCIHPPLFNIELDSIVVDELHLMLRVGMCCSEISSYMPTAGNMLAESIEEKTPTIPGSWNEPFGPVGSVSRYGRNGSQLENQSPVALIGQPSQANTSYKF